MTCTKIMTDILGVPYSFQNVYINNIYLYDSLRSFITANLTMLPI